MNRRRWFALAGGTAAALILAEVGLRVARPVRAYPYRPGTVKVFEPPETVRGVTGPAEFTVNGFGCRGPEPAGEVRRLLVLGGSTAACVALDDSEHWPQLVMVRVAERLGDPDALWVTNAGMSGRHSGHHVMHARHLVPRIPELDHVLIYCGLNDVVRWLGDPRTGIRDLADPVVSRETLHQAFAVHDIVPADAPPPARSRLWRALVGVDRRSPATPASRSTGEVELDEQMQWIETWRRRRERAEVLTVPPAVLATFPGVLDVYRANLREIVTAARRHGAEPVLVTQAMHWRALNDEQKAELWLGVMDSGQAFVDPDQMQELVGRCNGVMREVAAELDVLLLDLAAELRGVGLFYDGCHLTEHGAAEVGRLVGDFLVERVYRIDSRGAAEGR